MAISNERGLSLMVAEGCYKNPFHYFHICDITLQLLISFALWMIRLISPFRRMSSMSIQQVPTNKKLNFL